MRVLVPLIAALVPLIITPGLLAYFDVTPKIVILLLGVSLSVLFPHENLRNVRAIVRTPAGRWFVALLAAVWLSSAMATVLSSNPLLSLNGGDWRRFGLLSQTSLLLFVLLSAAWMTVDRQNVRTLLRWCTASGGMGALYGIFQYFGWDPWLPAKAYQAGEGAFTIVRPPGTLGHADYFAAWLVAVAFMALALRQMESDRWKKVGAGAVCALAVLAIVLSGTRSAVLGLMAGALVFAVLRRSRIRARAVAIGLAAAVGLVLFFYSPAGGKLRARLYWSLDDARGGARLLLWRDSWRMSGHRPFSGFDLETFATEFPRFESVELARAYPDFYHESPHNMFLDVLAGEGALGLLVLVGLCGLALWSGRRNSPALSAGFAAMLVCQQFAVLVFATALYFYLLIALLVIQDAPAQTREERTSIRWLLPFGLAVSLVLAVFALRLLVADRALAVAQHRLESDDASGAAQAYQVSLRWKPGGAGADLSYSMAMGQLASRSLIFGTRLQARQQAIEAGVRATRTSDDRQNAWYNLALLLASENDSTGVERSLRNAIAWAPNWFKPHWTLAQLLEMTGRHDEALAEAAAAVERDGGRDPEVTQTLEKLRQGHNGPP
jgi:O-antigen ligase